MQETEEDTMMHCMHAAGDAPCVDPEPTFCESWTATCGEWMMDTSCEDWWAPAAPGVEGDSTGASHACYEYHLGVAQVQETEEDTIMHCMHAAGDAPCVDPEPTGPGACIADAGFACNPIVADSCDTAAGEACDGNNPGTNAGVESGEFQCYGGTVNTAKVGEECGKELNVFCEQGLTCTNPYINTMVPTCRPVCCSNDACGMGEVCGVNSKPDWSTVNQAYGLGICEPVQP